MKHILSFTQYHLQVAPMLSSIRDLLQTYISADVERLSQERALQVIPDVAYTILQDEDHHTILPFSAAWLVMFAAIIRLDDLQDGEQQTPPFPNDAPVHELYTLIWAYYVFANYLLDQLDIEHISPQRVTRLRTFWNSMMLRMVSGQYIDIQPISNTDSNTVLDTYQDIAQAKTGATFALAFGGTAMLLTDEKLIYEHLSVIGEIFGTLLQYGDDFEDHLTQKNATLTLPGALNIAQTTTHTIPQQLVFPLIYATYYKAVEDHLAFLPVLTRKKVTDIFSDIFNSPQGFDI